MKQFIVFDVATRAILRVGNCQDDDIALQAHAGEAVKDADDDEYLAARSGALEILPEDDA